MIKSATTHTQLHTVLRHQSSILWLLLMLVNKSRLFDPAASTAALKQQGRYHTSHWHNTGGHHNVQHWALVICNITETHTASLDNLSGGPLKCWESSGALCLSLTSVLTCMTSLRLNVKPVFKQKKGRVSSGLGFRSFRFLTSYLNKILNYLRFLSRVW